MDVIAAILDREPAPLTQPEAPAELQRIASRALYKGLEERYQTSGELLVDLKKLRLNLEIAGNEKLPAERAVSVVAPPSPSCLSSTRTPIPRASIFRRASPRA